MYDNSSTIDRLSLFVRSSSISVLTLFNIFFPKHGDTVTYNIKRMNYIVDNNEFEYEYDNETDLSSLRTSEQGSCSVAEGHASDGSYIGSDEGKSDAQDIDKESDECESTEGRDS